MFKRILKMALICPFPIKGRVVSPQVYGQMWKVSDDEKCTDVKPPKSKKCKKEVCDAGLSNFAAAMFLI